MVTIVYTFAGGKLVWEIQLSLGSHDSLGAVRSIKAILGRISLHFTSRFRTVRTYAHISLLKQYEDALVFRSFDQFSVQLRSLKEIYKTRRYQWK